MKLELFDKLPEQSSFIFNVLRVIAAESVILGHSINFFKLIPGKHDLAFPYIESIAVVIFFIISGLLVTFSIFNKHKNHSFQEFFINRFSRIYSGLIPCIFFILTVNLITVHYFYSSEFYFNISIKDFFANLFMLQNYDVVVFNAHSPEIIKYIFGYQTFGTGLGPLWTLSIEWWLYISFGLFIFFGDDILKLNKRGILAIPCIIFSSFVPFFNILGGYGSGLSLIWFLSGIALIFISRLPVRNKSYLKITVLFFIALLLSIFRFIYAGYSSYDFLFDTLVLISISLLILPSLTESYPEKLFKGKKIFNFISGYSYTLYLIHFSLLKLLYGALHQYLPPIVLITINIILCNIIAIFIAKFGEKQNKYIENKIYKFVALFKT